MSKMGLQVPFEYLKHKLWPKEKLRIALTYLRAGGMSHIVAKLSMRPTIFL
jgi:hypothetical protein